MAWDSVLLVLFSTFSKRYWNDNSSNNNNNLTIPKAAERREQEKTSQLLFPLRRVCQKHVKKMRTRWQKHMNAANQTKQRKNCTLQLYHSRPEDATKTNVGGVMLA